jgi:hypothetical protein
MSSRYHRRRQQKSREELIFGLIVSSIVLSFFITATRMPDWKIGDELYKVQCPENPFCEDTLKIKVIDIKDNWIKCEHKDGTIDSRIGWKFRGYEKMEALIDHDTQN